MSDVGPTRDESLRILLVEDDARLANLVREYLEKHGFRVMVEHRGDQALARIQAECPDLLVLDLMLPGMDGFDICRAVRPDFPGPILMLTARDEDIDQVVGLELGADDYVTKPVQPRVLLARLRALVRRFGLAGAKVGESQTDAPVTFGKLRIESQSRNVILDGSPVELSTGEFDLLVLLARHAGEVLSRDGILKALRGIGYDGLDRSVDIAVSRLRRKLGDDAAHPFRIKTVRGRGYLFVPDTWN